MDPEKCTRKAAEIAGTLAEMGLGFICPHTNSHWPSQYIKKKSGDDRIDWYTMDIEILKRCDAILMIGEWIKSKGATKEYDYARSRNIPVFLEKDIERLKEVFDNPFSEPKYINCSKCNHRFKTRSDRRSNDVRCFVCGYRFKLEEI